MTQTVRTAGYLQTADRALEVLLAFTAQTPEWGVTDLSRHLGLDKSQVQRLMATLATRRFLQPIPETRRYRLGAALIPLGRLAEDNDALAAAARDLLGGLATRTGESALLVVPDGTRYRCTAAVDGPGPLRYATSIGRSYPGVGGASGHAIFAYYPDRRVEELFGTKGFGADDGSGGLLTLAELKALYGGVRARGYAISQGEYDRRVAAVAAPIFGQGVVVGALSVIGPRESVTGALDAIAADVVEAARRATAAFNAAPSRS